MPLLILVIASFLLFFVIVVLLWVASTLESRAIGRERILTRAKPLALLWISEAFDPIYAVLWEAPIAALELMDSAGTPGIPVVPLRPIYEGPRLVSQKFMTVVVFCTGFNSWKRHSSSHDIATK